MRARRPGRGSFRAVPEPAARRRQRPEVLLQRVPEAKHGKNRVHLDLRTRELEAETGRLAALGARVLTAQPVSEYGWRWHVIADLDGNEFCVLQPPAGYWPS